MNGVQALPTPPSGLSPRSMKVGPIPETLASLLGAMEARKSFIKQAYSDSEEYWQCQRDLADLERRWAEAEAVWAKHLAKQAPK